MKSRFSRHFSSAALIASLAIGSALSLAQPVPGDGMGSRGKFATAQGMGHGDGQITARMEALRAKLNLNATQEAQFNAARDATKSAMDAGQAARTAAREAAKAELQKADPDLAMLLLSREKVAESNAPLRKAAMNEWAKFLGLLTMEQKATVKSQLLDRSMRAHS